MSLAGNPEPLRLPDSLEGQLARFRSKVWSVKGLEAAGATTFGIVMAMLALFVLDRFWETPDSVRLALFLAAAAVCTVIPYTLYRWVWKNRKLEQLARTLSRTNPIFGDHLLGVIELVKNASEQSRSRALCEAAVVQVAEDASRRDLNRAVPNPRHRLWAGLAAIPVVTAIALTVIVPAAASNAWARFFAPWKPIPRYTFAAVEPLAATIVVPHGEAFEITAALKPDTAWRPKQGLARLGNQRAVPALLKDDRYVFTLPSQIEPTELDLTVADYRQHIKIEPMLRPELTAVNASLTLPAYLQRPGSIHKDVRGGAISLVKGSTSKFSAVAGRDLASAKVDGKPASVSGATVTSDAVAVEESRKLSFTWEDRYGLAGKEPFTLTLTARDDETPSLGVEDLPRQKVVLETEILNFKVRAQDDFGIKGIGIEWEGVGDPSLSAPSVGERLISAGGPDKDALDVKGTFSAKALGIEPQPINLRVYTEDYFPGRPRTYSTVFSLYILNAEQHAVWLTEQFSKWHRQSLEVRDREMQLYETNKQLRELAGDELDKPETRKKIESQSDAERANGRRLSSLVMGGEDLVKQAMRNPEFGVGHLEKWAEMLQILKDISGNRMPNVADLLKQAAQSPKLAMASPTNGKNATAGQMRAGGGGGTPPEVRPSKNPPPNVPGVTDGESSQNSPGKPGEPKEAQKKNPSSPSLRLPTTTIMGKAGDPPPPTEPPPPMEEAVQKQKDLLAEFERISDELNKVLANLEGSTLVKRLKAASRLQYRIAGRINELVPDTFGVNKLPSREENQQNVAMGMMVRRMLPGANPPKEPKAEPADTTPVGKVLGEMSNLESKGSQDISIVMDDMQSYFERRRYMQFKNVLDEMRKVDVIGGLRSLGDDLKREQGLSIAQCEYWSDTLDRWAEDLVDPSKSGSCPGGRTKASLPPSIILEVLQILEGEINLREETRVAQQARPALETEEFAKQAGKLVESQKTLKDRTENVVEKIFLLPDAEEEFAKEIQLLEQVASVMDEAAGILGTPETGSTAIAAETEVIELLLKSKRINPGGGGGGGSTPGGGGGGTTRDSALSLIGSGVNDKEVREDRGAVQTTGDSGPALPEEFRSGLDEYFNRLEKAPASAPSGGE